MGPYAVHFSLFAPAVHLSASSLSLPLCVHWNVQQRGTRLYLMSVTSIRQEFREGSPIGIFPVFAFHSYSPAVNIPSHTSQESLKALRALAMPAQASVCMYNPAWLCSWTSYIWYAGAVGTCRATPLSMRSSCCVEEALWRAAGGEQPESTV